jgi:hypothetical protein
MLILAFDLSDGVLLIKDLNCKLNTDAAGIKVRITDLSSWCLVTHKLSYPLSVARCLIFQAWEHNNEHRQCLFRFQISRLACPPKIMANTKIQAPKYK